MTDICKCGCGMPAKSPGILNNHKPRRLVALPNFSPDEGKCNCGCGKITSDIMMLRLQCFIFLLEAQMKCKIRCVITGPARCKAKQIQVYTDKGFAVEDVPGSYHLGPNRGVGDDGKPGEATDVCMYQINAEGESIAIPRAVVASAAKKSGLFGGVIHKIYDGDNSEFVHLDMGPVREL